MEIGSPAQLEFSRYLRPGDLVAWGQACGEPQSLTEALMAQRAGVPGTRCFLGIPCTDTVRPEHGDDLRFLSYSGAGPNQALLRAGVLDIVPCHYSALPSLLSAGPLRADVVLLALPPARPDGSHGLGLCADYVAAVARSARVVAEVNDQVPDVGCAPALPRERLDVVVRTSRPPAEYDAARPAGPAEVAIGELVAGLVPDGATPELGTGSMPSVALRSLAGPASIARSDAGVVVTEHGVADLRGQPVRERQRRMLAIADPAHRAGLEAELA